MSFPHDDNTIDREPEGDRWLPEIPYAPLAKRYQIEGEAIGRGGFGIVYRAKKLQLPQYVAVKRLLTDDGDDDTAPSLSRQKRFAREVKLAAQLNHPHVVRIQEWGRDDDGLYVVMDLLEGGSLRQKLDQEGPMPLEKLLQYARQICLGLQAAHQQGTIHRDLKPANILLDKLGNALLADFGLARSFSNDREALLKSSGVPGFTVAYASPEQMAGEQLDVATDLFSLGATLYHMATGRPAYDRDFDLEEIPKELQGLLSQLLKKKRDQRPPSVDAVLEQVDHLQTPRGPAASPPAGRTASPATAVKPAEEDLASLVEKVLAKVATQHTEARELLSRQRYAEAVAALEKIPEAQRHLLDSGLYQECVGLRDRVQSLDQEIKTAILAARFDGVREKVETLRKLQPWRADLERLLKSLPAEAESRAPASVEKKPAPPVKPVPAAPPKRPELLRAPFTPAAATAAQAAWAAFLKREVQWKDQFGHELRLIPPGEFQMGSDETAEQLEAAGFVLPDGDWRAWIKAESPRHRVRITQPVYLGVSSVTRGQFAAFVRATGYRTEAETDGKGGWGYVAATKTSAQKPEFTWKNTGFEQTDEHPVVNVTWNDVQAYVKWLNETTGTSGRYRLPREAEWEYACRAGTTTRFFTGDKLESLQGFANVLDESFAKAYPGVDFKKWQKFPFDDGSPFTSPGGRYSSNPFGLYDVAGNVWDWCEDWCDAAYYSKSPTDDPTGLPAGSFRVLRGGSWGNGPISLRSSNRNSGTPDHRRSNIGCRVL
ncbi:MAG: bifunctional serine/threonine-protein kinase/formylglycine-generating enzyme family protein, partial [Planctomycetaceae bacterium]